MQNYGLTESNYITSISGITEIKNYNQQSTFKKLNSLIYGNLQESVFSLGKINLYLGLWAGLAGVFFLVSIIIFAAFQVFDEKMQLGEMMAILGIAGTLLPAISGLALVSVPINEGKVAFSRMFEFLNIKEEDKSGTEIKKIEELKVQNLSFRYVGRNQMLKNINLTLKKGVIASLVGESGSGKSTIAELIQKSFGWENGDIIVNKNISLNDIAIGSWRSIIGVVPQEITIFSGSVIDNILFGKNEKPEKVIDFCKEFGFDKFINEMPQGYVTLLGEEGVNISGGQKQIIALARVLFNRPQLLILDEATSAMDTETEKFSLNLLIKLKNKISILFITHRLHILKEFSDTIFILEDGSISEFGSHRELMKTANLYHNYWKNILSA